MKNENIKFDPIAKSIILKKIDQFNTKIQSALIDEYDHFLSIEKKKKYVKDFENIMFNKKWDPLKSRKLVFGDWENLAIIEKNFNEILEKRVANI